MNRLFVAAIASVLILGTGAVIVLLSQPDEPETLSANAYLIADFTLTTDDGRSVGMDDFGARPSAWFFGFTHCPDVCPTALAEMTAHLQSLGEDAEKIDMVFVTVDPERDTQAVMSTYLGAFDPRIIGLTGDLAEIEKLARGFYVYFQKVALESGDYTMDHTAGILLRAADGQFLGTLDPHESRDVQLQKLRRAIAA